MRTDGWAELIVASHLREVGDRVCGAGELMDLNSVVLCHDTCDDPLFVYANRAAQRLWERSWDNFIGLPSRLTANEAERVERAAALSGPGVVRGYAGERVTAHGQRFWIRDATVWPVYDYGRHGQEPRLVGQAATFNSWEFLHEA